MALENSNNIRNFVIIAHIDAGKSTLADRFLEFTETVEERKMQEQFLDRMDLERERGITIKMQPVTMHYRASQIQNSKFLPAGRHGEIQNSDSEQEYVLNLIDTPGHVDFSYEVSRSLAAVEGAVLLVDATKGVQAQTVAHLNVAVQQGLKIIPAINKIDLPQAQVKEAEEEIISLMLSLDYDVGTIHKISAKTGEGVGELLADVAQKVPAPRADSSAPLRALIFDSVYDDYRGVISYVRLFGGEAKAGDDILFMASGETSEIKETGLFSPDYIKTDKLSAGRIGYIVGGIKSVEQGRIGDTITFTQGNGRAKEPISGYRQPQPVVFSTIFTTSDADYEDLRDALGKLKLNDASLHFEPESSPVLGRGFKAGFLGLLHMDIILERLRREYNLELLVTAPSVVYKVKNKSGEEMEVFTPSQFPDPSVVEGAKEPWVHLELFMPPEYMNNAMNLLKTIRGEYKDTEYLGADRLRIHYEAPLAEIITDFYDNLKNTTSGFGSLAYKIIDWREVDLVKLDILLAGEEVPALARLVPRSLAESEGRKLAKKIKEVIPAEQFAVAIQAAIGGKVVARETKSAMRKDVTAGLYGGDVTRKKKLLQKQKKGKKKLKEKGRVELEADTLMRIFQ